MDEDEAPAPPELASSCRGVTRAGHPCGVRRELLNHEGGCIAHAPGEEAAALRLAAQSRGGRSSTRSLARPTRQGAVGGMPSSITSIPAVVSAYSSTIQSLVAGEINSRDANALGMLLSGL